MKFERRHLLLNYIFISCVTILVLNDHIFKWEFSNWFTGKLSDVVGMLILPFLITYLNPKYVKLNLLISALLFMFWKSSLSTSAIDFYNEYAFIKTSRIIDYTDYIALLMLPLDYFIINKIKTEPSFFSINTKLNSAFVLIPTLFILISEAPPRDYYLTHSFGNFKCHNCNITLNMSQREIVEKIKGLKIQLNLSYENGNDKFGFKESKLNYYKVKELIIENDTLKNADFSMINTSDGKTTLYFNGFQYDKEITNKKMKRKLQRHFKKLMKNYLKNL